MATVARPDFVTVIPGRLSVHGNNKIPVVSADQDRTVSKLRVDLRVASAGADVKIECFAASVSLGVVTVTAGSLSGENDITNTVVSSGTQIIWKVTQTGSPGTEGKNATCSARVE